MDAQDLADYLTRLLGRPVGLDETVKLTSAQKGRLAGWLAERSVDVSSLRARVEAGFTPQRLLGEASSGVTATVREARPASSVATADAGFGVGIDIQAIGELIPSNALADAKASAELRAIFTMREISYAQAKSDPAETLAGLFAAKEALRKCDGRLLAKNLTDIEVLPDNAGRPSFENFALSISHSGGFAIAVAASRSEPAAVVTSVSAVASAAPVAVPAPVSRMPLLAGGLFLVAVGAALMLLVQRLGIFQIH